MGASRSAAANIVDVFARLQRDGVQQTFRDLDIDAAFAGSPEDAFLALTDVICSDGGLWMKASRAMHGAKSQAASSSLASQTLLR